MEIGQQLVLITKEMNISFQLNEKSITHEDVFNQIGLLPAIIRRADQLCSFCLGYGLGITFEEASSSKLGVQVKFDDTVPHSLRLMCAVEIIYELIESSANRDIISLDELMYD